jgi:dihydrofolate synthase/folylpolyglutamate synthase
VVGLLDGRDPAEFIGRLGIGSGDLVIVTEPPSDRRQPTGDVARAAEALGTGAEFELVAAWSDAFGRAVALSSEDDLIVVAGSLYLVGAVRSLLVDVASAEAMPSDTSGE